MADKAKAAAGPACLRLVAVLMYGCRPSGLDGDRIDHVASRGKCAHLVRALGQITAAAGRATNEPCLFVVNIQVWSFFSLKLDGAWCVCVRVCARVRASVAFAWYYKCGYALGLTHPWYVCRSVCLLLLPSSS